MQVLLVVSGAYWRCYRWRLLALLTSLSLFRRLNDDYLLNVRLSFAACSDRSDNLNVSDLLNAQVEGNQVGTCAHEAYMDSIVGIELCWVGTTLGSRPEGLAVRVQTVRSKHTKQVTNVVIEVAIKQLASHLHTGLETSILFKLHDCGHLVHLI